MFHVFKLSRGLRKCAAKKYQAYTRSSGSLTDGGAEIRQDWEDVNEDRLFLSGCCNKHVSVSTDVMIASNEWNHTYKASPRSFSKIVHNCITASSRPILTCAKLPKPKTYRVQLIRSGITPPSVTPSGTKIAKANAIPSQIRSFTYLSRIVCPPSPYPINPVMVEQRTRRAE